MADQRRRARRSRHEDEVQEPYHSDRLPRGGDRRPAAQARRLAPAGPAPRGAARETEASLAGVTAQNERLAATLREARDQIVTLKEEVDRLAQPPSGFGVFLQAQRGRHRRHLHRRPQAAGGRQSPTSSWPSCARARRSCSTRRSTSSSRSASRRSARSSCSRSSSRTATAPWSSGTPTRSGSSASPSRCCDAAAARRRLAAARAAVRLRLRADPQDRGRGARPRRGPGHRLRATSAASAGQIEQIRDAVELPFLHADLFREHQLRAAEGRPALRPARLRQDADRQGGRQLAGQEGRRAAPARPKATSYFLNIKGPELLNKYVGETERHIRLVFQRAREKASEGTPVIVFFDEMDSLFRTRGSGVSSDVENTIVPQLLSARSTASRAWRTSSSSAPPTART